MSDKLQKLKIPLPDKRLFDVNHLRIGTAPCQDLDEFTRETFLNEDHFLFNFDHIHLTAARIGYLFTTEPNSRNGKGIIGTCEIPMFRCGKWQKARQEQQIYEWFGFMPDFLITYSAPFWMNEIENAMPQNVLSLYEHELYHAGQAKDDFGMPKFSRATGKPVFAMAPHSVEEHTGVVRRYGVSASGQDAVDFVSAALQDPEIAPARLKGLCGSCVK